jgi:hypothetical protein
MMALTTFLSMALCFPLLIVLIIGAPVVHALTISFLEQTETESISVLIKRTKKLGQIYFCND